MHAELYSSVTTKYVGDCLKNKVKIYVCSLETDSLVDIDKICSHCGPRHTNEMISQHSRHFHGSSSFLAEDQAKIVETMSEICEEKNLAYEIVDIANLSLLGKMKLFFKGIRAPTIVLEGKKIEGIPTQEDLEALTNKASTIPPKQKIRLSEYKTYRRRFKLH